MSEMKNTLNKISRLDATEEKIFEVPYIAIEMIQYKTQEEERGRERVICYLNKSVSCGMTSNNLIYV